MIRFHLTVVFIMINPVSNNQYVMISLLIFFPVLACVLCLWLIWRVIDYSNFSAVSFVVILLKVFLIMVKSERVTH